MTITNTSTNIEGGDGYGLLYKLSLIDVLELICFYQIDLTMVLPLYTIHVHEAGGDSIMYVCLLIMLLSIASVLDSICMHWYDIIDDNA